MKRSLRNLLFVLLILASNVGISQNDFFFNHYSFNPVYFNPAWAGVEDQAFAAAHHRTQWAGYDATLDPGGAPTTQLLSIVVPIQGKLSGLGLSIVNDQTGPLNSVQARMAIATSFSFRKGEISFGIMPAINAFSLNTNYRFAQDGDRVIESLIANGFNEMLFNFHSGIVFQSTKDYWIGLSVENILEPEYSVSPETGNNLARSFNFFAGKSLGISRDLVLDVNTLLRSDLNAYSLDLTAILEYQEKMWGGLAFRRAESLSLLIGYSFLQDNKLKAGYSFDYIIQERDAKQPTSHEVFIRFNLPDLVFGGRKAVKTPRFAF